MRRWNAVLAVVGFVALLALAGCGRRITPQTQQEEKPKPPPAPTSTTLQNSTVKVADPKGQWTFDGTARTVTVAGKDGPYEMQQAHGTYRRPTEPPVQMTAARLRLDKAKEWATLEGEVRISNGALTVEGNRIQYNLKTGKVIATTQTKWTFTPGAAGATPKQLAADKGGKP